MNLSRLKTDLLALALLAGTVFVALALVSYDPADPPGLVVHPPRAIPRNLCGLAGSHVAYALHHVCGLGSWFVLGTLGIADALLFARKWNETLLRTLGATLMLTVLCVTLQALCPAAGPISPIGSGGFIGAVGWTILSEQFTQNGSLLLLSTMLVVGTYLATDLWLLQAVWWFVCLPAKVFDTGRVAVKPPVQKQRIVRRAEIVRSHRTEEPKKLEAAAAIPINAPLAAEPVVDEVPEEDEAVEETMPLDPDPPPTPREPVRVNPPISASSKRAELLRELEVQQQAYEFELPSVDLLETAEAFPYEFLADKARIAAGTLEKTFREFGLNVKVVEIDTGPVITQFELELEAGLRLNKITALADDLAIALRVPSVRVVASIPGKNTVGVEVPNEKQVMVRLRELIESCPDALKRRIPVFLGKDVSGRPLVIDLCKMPHLLIAGRTGTGKSVCLNTLISSILMTRTPDQVKLLMIDPKMVELSPYMRVPHLMHPVITDMKKAEAVLGWAVEKMEERYDLLARCGVRHLDSYNDLPRETKLTRLGIDPDSDDALQIPDHMPYIVIIADEMADMMMTSGKEVEAHIIRLAQKSRAVGIHLVLATQKPTVDVITGLIKSNLPARIAFQVASRTDSRVVLDEMGADKLLGNGDMLYLAPGGSRITRAQGTYTSDQEVEQIIDFYSQYEPQYSRELSQLGSKATGKSGIEAIRARDEVYEQAIEVVVREGRGSCSLLQRALGIGYGRAARLIDYMAEDGIVGDYNGSQARDVLYTPEQWAEFAGTEMVEA